MTFPMKAVVLLLLFSCSKPNQQDDIATLLELNENQRQAHLKGDADLLVFDMADSLVSIQDGEIYLSSKEAVQARFSRYFTTITYKKWDDLQPPRIELSLDGSHATVITKKVTEAATLANDSIGEYSEVYWAWMTAYRKVNGEWKMYSLSSGRKQQ